MSREKQPPPQKSATPFHGPTTTATPLPARARCPHAPVPLTHPAAPGLTLPSGRGFFSNPTNGSARHRAASWEQGAAAAQGTTGSVVPEGRGRLLRFALGPRPRSAGSERPGQLCRGCGAAVIQDRAATATRGRQRLAPPRQQDPGCRGKAPWPRRAWPHLPAAPGPRLSQVRQEDECKLSLSELCVITGLLLCVYKQVNRCLQVVRGKRSVTCSMPCPRTEIS